MQQWEDKVDPEYQGAINDVVNLAGVIDMPYDFLRAIAFELNQGYGLKEAMSDLNITRVNSMKFDIKVYLTNGLCFEAWSERINLSDHDLHWVRVKRYRDRDNKNDNLPLELSIQFVPALAHMVGSEYIINERIVYPKWDSDDFFDVSDEEAKQLADIMNKQRIERIVLTKVADYGPARYTCAKCSGSYWCSLQTNRQKQVAGFTSLRFASIFLWGSKRFRQVVKSIKNAGRRRTLRSNQKKR